MNKTEMKQALELAKTRTAPEGGTDISIFSGFGLRSFEPVAVTLDSVAALINWQALQFNGIGSKPSTNSDSEMEMARILRMKWNWPLLT